ncbi:hypothetical protein Taro_000683 [Colocasia esculenta]|uniref:Uncharacterized protein n=1 Tax=Colocasia esculenta TaxID=4460 RepID=A0A843TCP4_COLES|nr:hypothetical protein [Colocasia esculenta]
MPMGTKRRGKRVEEGAGHDEDGADANEAQWGRSGALDGDGTRRMGRRVGLGAHSDRVVHKYGCAIGAPSLAAIKATSFAHPNSSPAAHSTHAPPSSFDLPLVSLEDSLPIKFSVLILLVVYMSGVWVFKDGVYRLAGKQGESSTSRRKVLVHKPTGAVITSHAMLEPKLVELGWERYLNDPDLLQFHKRTSVDLISLPRDFSKMQTTHMYDLVVKTRYVFEVRDA